MVLPAYRPSDFPGQLRQGQTCPVSPDIQVKQIFPPVDPTVVELGQDVVELGEGSVDRCEEEGGGVADDQGIRDRKSKGVIFFQR